MVSNVGVAYLDNFTVIVSPATGVDSRCGNEPWIVTVPPVSDTIKLLYITVMMAKSICFYVCETQCFMILIYDVFSAKHLTVLGLWQNLKIPYP